MKHLQTVAICSLLALWPSLVQAHDGPDGKITHRHNEVRAQPDAEATDWSEAEVGDLIYKQGRVNTLDASTAAVAMRDQGSVALRENTLLIIYGHHALRDKKIIAMEAELERGSLRTRLDELDGSAVTATLGTPGAETTLEGGNSLIKVDDAGTSRVHNHGDGKAKVKGKKGGQVDLKRGMGVKVEKKKRVRKPVPLPPTPAWAGGPQVFLGVAGHLSVLRGSWTPVAEANTYYVEIAGDPEGVEVISVVEVPKTVDSFEVHGLPAGDYYVRVSSINDDLFESIPSEVFNAELLDVALVGPGDVAASWPEDGGLMPTPTLLPGSALELPEGIRCGLSEDTLAARPVLVEPGVHELLCAREDGAPVVGFSVEVPVLGSKVRELAVVPTSEASAGDSESGEAGDSEAAAQAQAQAQADAEPAPLSEQLVLTRGVEGRHELVLDTELELPSTLYLAPPAGVTVGAIEAGLEPGTWTVTLTAGAEAVDGAELGLSFIDPASFEGELPTFTQVGLSVVEPPAQEPQLPPERHMFELGIAGGPMLLSTNHRLFAASETEHQAYARPAGEVVLRVGYYPIRWVGVELDGRIAPTRVANEESALVYSARAQLIGQLPYRVTPFVVAGGELLGVRSQPAALGRDVDFGGHVGGGLKIYVTNKVALRFGVTAMFHQGLDGSTATHLDADFGLSFVLGRSSADRLAQKPNKEEPG